MGSSWSCFIWPQIEQIFPFNLIGGLRKVQESDLSGLTPFYQSVIRSYVMTNDLFYTQNKGVDLQHNLWGDPYMPGLIKLGVRQDYVPLWMCLQ